MSNEWVMVPREPTANQLVDGAYEVPDPISHRGELTARMVYRAMLDAAPVPTAADCTSVCDAYAAENQQFSDELTRLRAEVEALRADAERYRWIRDGSNPPWVMQMLERYADNGSDFDAEVDAARAAQGVV